MTRHLGTNFTANGPPGLYSILHAGCRRATSPLRAFTWAPSSRSTSTRCGVDVVRRGRRLLAAIEIVSPANKDRLEHRRALVAKCSALLQQRVAVSLVDLVTTRHFHLYGDSQEPGVAGRNLVPPPGDRTTAADAAVVAERRSRHPAGVGAELRRNVSRAAAAVKRGEQLPQKARKAEKVRHGFSLFSGIHLWD